jgi:hypothetical protein
VPISGFTIVRNATMLDFPLEASIRSVLPVVDEFIVNVGVSEDDTLDRVRAIGDHRIRVIESRWDPARGPAMLADETERARLACAHPWGIYIQADEVLVDGGAERLASAIDAHDGNPRVEGVLVDYVHFYGGFDTIATNRSWYRRETRAIRLGADHQIHSFRDAQGFRVGDRNRRIRCATSGATMLHYGWARPAWAIAAKRDADRAIYPWRQHQDADRPLLPWIPGIRAFGGEHPRVARAWIDARRTAERLVLPRSWEAHHAKLVISGAIERISGWRPFEYRNYELLKG